MVIKDTKDAEEFFNARFWRDRRPREVKIHQLLEAGRSNGTGFDNVVRFRTYRLMMGHKRLRLFTDYYPGKDMNRSLRPMLKLYHRDGSVEPPSEFWIPLPERFLWEAFRDLVNACLVMQQGDVRDAKKDWKPITHCDLHAANIMLDINESLTGYEVSNPIIMWNGQLIYETSSNANIPGLWWAILACPFTTL